MGSRVESHQEPQRKQSVSRFQIFVREFDAGAFLVRNSRGEYFTTEGTWSFDPKQMKVFDDLETAREDSEACHAVERLLHPPQAFEGNLIVQLHSVGRPHRVRDVVSHLRETLTIGLDVQNFGYGGSHAPCFTTLSVDWNSFRERKTDQLEFSF